MNKFITTQHISHDNECLETTGVILADSTLYYPELHFLNKHVLTNFHEIQHIRCCGDPFQLKTEPI